MRTREGCLTPTLSSRQIVAVLDQGAAVVWADAIHIGSLVFGLAAAAITALLALRVVSAAECR